MSKEVVTVPPRRRSRRPVAEAAPLLAERRVNRLPVVDDSGLVGIVTRADLVRGFVRPDDQPEREIRAAAVP